MTSKRQTTAEQREELKRLTRHLAGKLREKDFKLRDVSVRLGWHPDRLSAVLKGRLLLRIEDLYSILAILEIPPAEFFAEVGRTDPKWRSDPVLAGRNPYEVLVGGMTRAELFDEIRRAMAREFALRDEMERERERRARLQGGPPAGSEQEEAAPEASRPKRRARSQATGRRREPGDS